MNNIEEKKWKSIVVLFLNIFIVAMEIAGIYMSYQSSRFRFVKYYTQDSNILVMFSSMMISIYIILNLKNDNKVVIPKGIKLMRYMSISCVTVTFIVVLFVLIPMQMEGWDSFRILMWKDAAIYHHLLCPIISFISFVFFEEKMKYEKSYTFVATIPTIIYAIVMIYLNIKRVLEGPYPFLYIYEQSLLVSAAWFVFMIGMAFLIAKFIKFVSGGNKSKFDVSENMINKKMCVEKIRVNK